MSKIANNNTRYYLFRLHAKCNPTHIRCFNVTLDNWYVYENRFDYNISDIHS